MKLQQLILSAVAGSAANEASLTVSPALWDGQCFYPQVDSSFKLSTYPGRWYQAAGTLAPFTAGCKCISALYDINVRFGVDFFIE
jgi:apolipoprotein D and lipocalin family protein